MTRIFEGMIMHNDSDHNVFYDSAVRYKDLNSVWNEIYNDILLEEKRMKKSVGITHFENLETKMYTVFTEYEDDEDFIETMNRLVERISYSRLEDVRICEINIIIYVGMNFIIDFQQCIYGEDEYHLLKTMISLPMRLAGFYLDVKNPNALGRMSWSWGIVCLSKKINNDGGIYIEKSDDGSTIDFCRGNSHEGLYVQFFRIKTVPGTRDFFMKAINLMRNEPELIEMMYRRGQSDYNNFGLMKKFSDTGREYFQDWMEFIGNECEFITVVK